MRDRYAEKRIAALDEISSENFGAPFRALTEERAGRPASAGAIGRPKRGRRGPSQERTPALQQTFAKTELEFLPLLVLHTRQGFYADPVYGGNRNRMGWKVIGFPANLSNGGLHQEISGLALVCRRRSGKVWEANGGK